MARAISVKVATPKVIKALETKLAKIKSDKTNQQTNEAKFDKAMEKWNKEVAKIATSSISKAENLSASTNWRDEICVSFTLPKGTIELPEQPKRDYEVLQDWKYNEIVEEIENAIRILKMTDEEVVNASTFKSIAQYL